MACSEIRTVIDALWKTGRIMEKNKKDSENVGFDLHMFKRLWKLMRVIFPGWCSLPVGLFFFLCLCLEQFLAYYVGLIPSQYYKVFGDRDQQGFMYLTLKSCGLILVISSDVDKLCLTLATITTKVIISPFQIGYYTYRVFVG
ncbi:ATP-binding cassette sub-family D member 4-like 1 [Homarus americanus]|uniref:ATP-binding cassette sub-family D member 4-like 1 n=1 Tax=Homarus americanus TaxID=6706 RepID=A0A8J5JR48_HOMAM|nr:ATP-binding cassette sub-family D member 4-like 1 [Homarus americanus]